MSFGRALDALEKPCPHGLSLFGVCAGRILRRFRFER